MTIYQGSMPTPIGTLKVCANEQGITQVEFTEDALEDNPNQHVSSALSQLQAFFAGQLKQFDLPLAAEGTDFRKQVWRELVKVPFGQTACYGDIADALNNPKAVRAVGAANGANPIAIIVPCHRIIGKDGSLTGYAGGLERKQWLLAFERAQR